MEYPQLNIQVLCGICPIKSTPRFRNAWTDQTYLLHGQLFRGQTAWPERAGER